MQDRLTFTSVGEPKQDRPHHYTESGLDNVYLANGFTIEQTDYGEAVTVHGSDALHLAIGRLLVTLPRALSSREFRFLRKLIGLTQSELGDELGVDAQTIARYEKEQTSIPRAAERLLRIRAVMLLEDTSEARDTLVEQIVSPVVRTEGRRDRPRRRPPNGPDGWCSLAA